MDNSLLDIDNEDILTVAVKLPPFWVTRPELWFIHADASFQVGNITSDSTKYYHVVKALEGEMLEHVSDIVSRPPTTGKYEAIKHALISAFSESSEKKIRRLLTSMELGDSKPSHLLRKMKELANGKLSEEILKSLWLKHLPSHTQSILSISRENVMTLAAMADSIHDIEDQTPTFKTVNSLASHTKTTAIPGPSTDQSNKILEELSNLKIEIANIKKEYSKRRYRSRSRNSSYNNRFRRFTTRSPTRSPDNPSLCYYHNRFKQEARKCRPPCSFKTEN